MNCVTLCFSCGTAPRVGDGIYCAACRKEADEYYAQVEALARTVACPSCDAQVGQPCVSASGVEREVSHMARQQKAEKKAKNSGQGSVVSGQ
jgi:hypothetical protein